MRQGPEYDLAVGRSVRTLGFPISRVSQRSGSAQPAWLLTPASHNCRCWETAMVAGFLPLTGRLRLSSLLSTEASAPVKDHYQHWGRELLALALPLK